MRYRRSRTTAKKRKFSNRKTSKPKSLFSKTPTEINTTIKWYGHREGGIRPVEGQRQEKIMTSVLQLSRQPSSSVQRYREIDMGKTYRKLRWQTPNPYHRHAVFVEAGPLYDGNISLHMPFVLAQVSRTPSQGSLDFTYQNSTGCNTTPTFAQLQSHYLEYNKKLLDQKVDILTVLGEGKATAEMLANAAHDLFDLYRKVRRGDLRGVRKFLKGRNIKKSVKKAWKNKTAENRWLELQYGWSPLFGDLKTAFEELAAERKALPPIYKVSKSIICGDEFSPVRPEWADYDKGNVKAFLKTAIYYSVEDDSLRTKAQWNLGTNPLLTAWELVPYSFVVDWFIPIGDFIAQLGSSDGLKFISGTTVYFAKWDISRVTTNHMFTEPGSVTHKSRIRCQGYSVHRIVHSRSPLGVPTFDFGLTTKRAINALALITQRR